MNRHPFVGLLAACGVSVLAHGLAYASLALTPKSSPPPPPSRVSFRIHEEPKRALPPLPPPPDPTPEARAQQAKPKPAPTVAAVAPPPAPVNLRGVTLTNDSGGGSWTSAIGNGQALDGPVGPVTAKAPTPALSARSVAPVDRASGVAVVDVADLSTRPVPPDLASNLREHYPAAAKARGLGGSATVRARIEPDGRVRRIELMGETVEGFGEACRRTLLGSSWSAPRDREGHAVATLVRYTCRFVAGH